MKSFLQVAEFKDWTLDLPPQVGEFLNLLGNHHTYPFISLQMFLVMGAIWTSILSEPLSRFNWNCPDTFPYHFQSFGIVCFPGKASYGFSSLIFQQECKTRLVSGNVLQWFLHYTVVKWWEEIVDKIYFSEVTAIYMSLPSILVTSVIAIFDES